jgi:plastocyanin
MLKSVLCGAALALGVDGSAGSAGGAETVTVSMKGRMFHPEHITVRVGDTVQWINDDTELHQVISGRSSFDRNAGSPMNSGILIWNQHYAFTFTTPGTYPYMCVIHRSLNDGKGEMGMVGEIVVSGESR